MGSTARPGLILVIQLVSWMGSKLTKLAKISVSSMMLREDSPSTESPIRRPSINYAASGQSRPDPRMFPSCTLLTAAPSVTPTQCQSERLHQVGHQHQQNHGL